MINFNTCIKDANNILTKSLDVLESYAKFIKEFIILPTIEKNGNPIFYQIVFDIILDFITIINLILLERMTQAFTLYRGAIEKIAILHILTNNEKLLPLYLDSINENIEYFSSDKKKRDEIRKKYSKNEREIKYFLQYKWCYEFFGTDHVSGDLIIKKANLDFLLKNKEFLDKIVHGIAFTTILKPSIQYYDMYILFTYEVCQLIKVLFKDLYMDVNIKLFRENWIEKYKDLKKQIDAFTNNHKESLISK